MREQAAVLLRSCLLELQFERLSIKLSVAPSIILCRANLHENIHTPKCFAKKLWAHADAVDCMFCFYN
jgi:hypothetical protein